MRRAQLIGGVFVLALLAIVVGWALRTDFRSEALVPTPVDTLERPAPEPVDHHFAEPMAPIVEAVAESSPLEGPTRVAVERVEPRHGPRTIRGTVTVLDPDGIPMEAPGEFYLGFYGGERLETHSVAFQDGVWSAQVDVSPLWNELEIRVPKVRGFHARVEEPKARVPFLLVDELDVVLRAPRRNVLRVIDAETGAPIRAVCVRKVYGSPGAHPGVDSECAFPPMPSPVDFDARPALLSTGRLHVGAEGYVWQVVKLDLEAGGERLVALERGADLVVFVQPRDLRDEHWLQLFVGHAALLPRVPIPEGGVIEVRGLRAGNVRVAIQSQLQQTAFGPLREVAEAEVELVAGLRTHLELTSAHRLPEPSAVGAPTHELLVRYVPGADGVLPIVLRWKPRTPGEPYSREVFETKWDPGREAFVIHTRHDMVWLGAMGPAGLLAEADITLTELEQEYTLRPGLPIGVNLSLRDGTLRMPFDTRTADEVELSSSSTGRELARRRLDWALTIQVTEPGTYTLRLPKLPGYRAVEPMTVRVDEGGLKELVVQLEREHP